MTMKKVTKNEDAQEVTAVWEMSCQEMTQIIMQDNKSPMGWREFQEELKKSDFVTELGVKQILAKALQSRVQELERRGNLQDSDGDGDDDDDDDDDASLNDFSSPSTSSSSRGPSSWSDSFRNLSLGDASKRVNKRGTMNMSMNMLMSGFGKEVQETISSSPAQSNRFDSSSSSVAAASAIRANRPGSTTVGHSHSKNHVPLVPTRGPLSRSSSSSFNSSSKRIGAAATAITANPSPNSSHNASSRRLSVALSTKNTRTVSMAHVSPSSTGGRSSTASKKDAARRGSMFAGLMRLEDETKYSMSQAVNNGTYINRRGSNGVDFTSTTDYSDVIHCVNDDDDDGGKIRSYKRLQSGKYAAAS